MSGHPLVESLHMLHVSTSLFVYIIGAYLIEKFTSTNTKTLLMENAEKLSA